MPAHNRIGRRRGHGRAGAGQFQGKYLVVKTQIVAVRFDRHLGQRIHILIWNAGQTVSL
jgi:hypothetical protein